MPWVGSAISAGASLLGGMMSSDSASSAADAQGQASAAAIAEQRRQYDQARSDNAPFRNTGVAANKRLAYLLGISPSGLTLDDFKGADALTSSAQPEKSPENLATQAQWAYDAYKSGASSPEYIKSQYGLDATTNTSSPDYGSLLRKFSASDLAADPVYNSGLEFGRSEGEGAINARALAGGSYDSGATLKALTRFGNDYGSTKAEGAYNRYNTDNTNIYNRLAGVSGTGQTATNAITTAGTNATNNISDLTTGAGNARAAGIVGGANAWGGALSGVSGAATNYNNNQTLMKLLNNGAGGGNSSYNSYSTNAYGMY